MNARQRFLAFLLVGGFAAAVNILARVLLSLFLSFSTAIVLAYLLGMLVAFTLNRLYVFRTQGSSTGQMVRFAAVNLVSLVQIWFVSTSLARFILPMLGEVWHTETIAHTLGVLSPVVTSYLAHKHYTFKVRS